MYNDQKRVVVKCPTCKAVAQLKQEGLPVSYDNLTWTLNTCTNCNWVILLQRQINNVTHRILQEILWPQVIDEKKLPVAVEMHSELKKEYLEAVKCMSVGANRAVIAMLRSTLEKILEKNGYKKEDSLKDKLEAAYKEGIIQKKNFLVVDDIVRLLGNEILHGDYREISFQDAIKSKEYVERIFEDFYDQRDKIDIILKECKRIS